MIQYSLRAGIYSVDFVSSELRHTHILKRSDIKSNCEVSRDIIVSRLINKGYDFDHETQKIIPGICLKHPTKNVVITFTISSEVESDIERYEDLLNKIETL